MARLASIGPVEAAYEPEASAPNLPVRVECNTSANVLHYIKPGQTLMSLSLSVPQAKDLMECLAFIFDYKLTKG